MENLTKISNKGLVIFAGAGCSMAPPSSLPNWNKLNEAILNTLWDKLEPYGLNNRFREQILTSIIQKRDDNKFPPDYQAQRMEERAGIKYFQLLSAVDSDTFNAIQYYAAIMAKEGLLKAVVTTNFDRNFERAFDAKQVDYTSYYDEDGFNDLTYNKTNKIPIIKIHGCCSSPSSMVDTKKQRLKGRAVSLQNTLSKLLTENYFIFSGFSGQDLDDNSNYLGLREAAPLAIGFTYLNLPGNIVKSGMQDLINNYGESKTSVVTCNPADYFEQLLSSYKIPFESFHPEAKTPQLSIEDRLKTKVASLTPMDAVNMLTALAESYGDEISARFIYDKVWKERDRLDYNDESFSRFLLNQGRSYVLNFEDKIERAKSAGVYIEQYIDSFEGDELYERAINPAKMNLRHTKNTSPETPALIGLLQTYTANPILFKDFPNNLAEYFQSEPTNLEMADIIYYYSFYALIYFDWECLQHLNFAIYEMEKECDEVRLSQLLCRRALLKLRADNEAIIESAKNDITRAFELAEKYNEPNLLALSEFAMAILARKNENYFDAIRFINESTKKYRELKRIPQYIECIIEYLKIAILGFSINSDDKEQLLRDIKYIRENVENYITERINVYEPEYCYLMGMILYEYTTAPREESLNFLADSISLAKQYDQPHNFNYFTETLSQLGLLDEVRDILNKPQNKDSSNTN